MSLNILNKNASKKLRKRISDRRRRFMKLTPNKQRIAIAKDVIAMIDSKKIIPSYNIGYMSFSANFSNKKVELCEIIETNQCRVCALGGMLAAHVMKVDNFRIDGDCLNSIHRFEITDQLEDYFSIEQLDLIESAFEVSHMGSSLPVDSNQINKAIKFGMTKLDTCARIKAIMQNIIDNDGTFVP